MERRKESQEPVLIILWREQLSGCPTHAGNGLECFPAEVLSYTFANVATPDEDPISTVDVRAQNRDAPIRVELADETPGS
jgi:hypothetical protein